MDIIAKPGIKSKINTATSPQCLYKTLKRLYGNDVNIYEWNMLNIVLNRYDIMHIHWPDNILQGYKYIIIIKINILILVLKLAKAKNAKIVWTSHNIYAHHNVPKEIEDYFWNKFLDNIDGIVYPSYSIKNDLINIRPAVKNKKYTINYFGDWSDLIPNNISKTIARKINNIDEDDFVLTWFGGIRKYKGIEKLIKSFVNIKNNKLKLIISGIVLDNEYEKTIRKEVAKDKRIIYKPGLVNNESIQYYFRCSNLAVYPFNEITNSGSVRLALHFGCPVLVPDFPIFKEMQSNFGANIIHTYNKEKIMISEDINRAINNTNKSKSTIEWGEWNWEVTSKKYYEFCKSLTNQ